MLLPQTDAFRSSAGRADLAVSRAGGTVWELAAAGTPAILVPYPYATADHQTLNARHFERGGGAIVVPDAEVDRVPALVDELLAAPERLAAMREAMLSLARPDAAEVIADELVALAQGGKRACVNQHGPSRAAGCTSSGIGGSGLSAYANIARAWGAEVRGWDAQETIFTETLEGVEIDLGGEPAPPEGFEVGRLDGPPGPVRRDTARGIPRRARRGAAVDRRHRRARQDDDDRDDRVRAARDRQRPGMDRRRRRAAARRQRRRRGRAGSSSRATSPTARSFALPAADRGRHERRARPSRGATASHGRARGDFEAWLADVPEVVRGWELEPVDFELAVPGEHNRRNAAAALAALDLARRATGTRRQRRSRGSRASIDASSSSASAAASRSIDDYGHNPTELAGDARDGTRADRRAR